VKRRFSSHTTLIELTAALLFFMLASVTILGLFMTAYAQGRQARRNTLALQLAQDCAGIVSGAQNVKETLTQTGYLLENGAYVRHAEDEMTVSAALNEQQTEVGFLLNAQIDVLQGEEAVLQLPVSRYYNKEVIHP